MSNGTKNAQCPGSAILATSYINDTNFDQWMVQWLKAVTSSKTQIQNEKSLILAISSSGKSRDLIKALQWGYANDLQLGCITAGSTEPPLDRTCTVVTPTRIGCDNNRSCIEHSWRWIARCS